MWWLFGTLSLLLAGLMGFLAQQGPGRLILTYQDWMVECPLWFALLLCLAVLGLTAFVQHVCYRITGFCKGLAEGWRQYRQGRVMQAQQGLQAFVHHLSHLCQTETMANIKAYWQKAPRAWRFDPEAFLMYIQALNHYGHHQLAESQLRQGIEQTWIDTWIRYYGLIKSPNPGDALKRAEKWLRQYPHHPQLLLTLGRLSLQNQLWGKAKAYLEASLQAAPHPETYAELGRLHESLGDLKAGDACYKKGLLSQQELLPIQFELSVH